MYPHTPASTATLQALRTRLYRPDPPEGAVEAYLEALRAEAPVTSTPAVQAIRRGRRGRTVGAAAATAVLALGLVAAMNLSHQASADVAGIPPRSAHLELPPVPGTPIGALYGADGTTGLFDAGGSRVVVSVECSGSGTLTLRIGEAPSSVLTCEPGGPALAMVPSAGSLDLFTIAVARQGPVQWSVAVGAVDLAGA